ncbi:MAG: hypothetical protein NVSMB21_24710 [Vulcanimicrobiaceae bacterium]
MADRLRTTIACCVIAIAGCGATRTEPHDPARSNAIGLASAVGAAGRALERYYDVERDGATEAFVSRALADGVPAGRSEPCRSPDGRLSTRPTVLANPPLSASSIRQRTALVATIGAYEVARARHARAAPIERSWPGSTATCTIASWRSTSSRTRTHKAISSSKIWRVR